MKTIFLPFFLITIIVFGVGCANSRKVSRVDTDTQIDLSGRWNDTDSRLAAEELTTQFLKVDWFESFRQENGRKPVLVVGLVRNKSHEHIDAETFIRDIEKAVIKYQQVILVQAGEKRNELRTEKADQQEFASPESKKKWGKELGADVILQGTINSIVDQYNKEQVTYYQIDIELTDIQTGQIVWLGDKKIKKYIKN
ncbi:MAG: penicillin-binding protein activator LpoB [Sphingobacteriia bacterium]|jgi:uncharacterized protein (TIGR02722 family)|nr:penicillin-binding protein activator LpoB [Sphingobacteriia bacterium]